MQFRLNGFGICFLSPEETSQKNEWIATRWITALFLPLFPLQRMRVQVTPALRGGSPLFSFHEQLPLSLRSILKTYFFGWMIMPLILLWPMPFAIWEVQAYLGMSEAFRTPALVFALLWITVSVISLKVWEERRWIRIKKG